jgi:hypothetical protein
VNSGFMIKFSSTTLCDVTCACVLPFARDVACPATFACLIGRAGAGLGLPCKHMLSRGGGAAGRVGAFSSPMASRDAGPVFLNTTPHTERLHSRRCGRHPLPKRLHSIRNPARSGSTVRAGL